MRLFLLFSLLLSLWATAQDEQARSPLATVAILPFTTHGYAEQQAPDAVIGPFSKVLNNHLDLYVIPSDTTLEKVELLGLTGTQTLLYDQALALACHSGARIFVTGTVLKSKRTTFLIARIIGVDSGRVTGCSVRSTDSLEVAAAELGKKVAATIDANRQGLLGPQTLTARQESLLTRKQAHQDEVISLDIKVLQPEVAEQLTAIAAAAGINLEDGGDTVTGSLSYEPLPPREGHQFAKALLTYSIVNGQGVEIVGGPIVGIARGETEEAARIKARDDVLFRIIDQLVPRDEE